jgi:hypothetical protein
VRAPKILYTGVQYSMIERRDRGGKRRKNKRRQQENDCEYYKYALYSVLYYYPVLYGVVLEYYSIL